MLIRNDTTKQNISLIPLIFAEKNNSNICDICEKYIWRNQTGTLTDNQ